MLGIRILLGDISHVHRKVVATCSCSDQPPFMCVCASAKGNRWRTPFWSSSDRSGHLIKEYFDTDICSRRRADLSRTPAAVTFTLPSSLRPEHRGDITRSERESVQVSELLYLTCRAQQDYITVSDPFYSGTLCLKKSIF